MLPRAISIPALLASALTPSLAQSIAGVDKRCTAPSQYCGNGAVCCPGSACSLSGYCTLYGTAGQYCGNAVPCASGLDCSTAGYCTPYGKRGDYCGNAVRCAAGLNCNWKDNLAVVTGFPHGAYHFLAVEPAIAISQCSATVASAMFHQPSLPGSTFITNH
ncbi:uncharacterized protein BBA_10052 [Beauveria bassiana ARSEF 2860]|uniref:Uncharacterized protein n=1 Tax=Beauveria bassiana (strain ARSEF 2860) TaxID=655819 RepID=J4UF21_BEAB2|nr:uncharacterized protein BBA_10052 [Beauveria bassiana ARSEF 2860]EJP60987.1 hypothetical protein BBA_10052 [Beauveria bassiana ARSEF 2860]